MNRALRAAALAAAFLSLSPPVLAELALRFDASIATVSGATPDADVVVLTVWREQFHGWSRVHRVSEVVQTTAEGTGRFEAPRAVPPASLWIVADVASGEHVVVSPGPRPYPQLGGAERRMTLQAARLSLDARSLEMVVVRPGIGAWSLALWDGGLGDADGATDGRLDAVVADLVPLGSAPASPGELAPRDLLLGIDPARMEHFVLRVAQSPR